MRRWGMLSGGIIAVAALLGMTKPLPPEVGFFVSALGIILFPGFALASLVGGRYLGPHSLPERLAIWFVAGTGLVSGVGLIGLILKVRLASLVIALILAYAVLAGLLVMRRARAHALRGGTTDGRRSPGVSPIAVVLISAALGLALITLITPRDYDDWYYLAYIKDFVSGARLASGDAIFDMGGPATPRIWFGGGWWVLEALLAKVSGTDPIACHQVYLPVLLIPFVVLALYTLARRLFPSTWGALLATGLQMLFYLSSAFPYKSAGWMVFARMSQDKAVACFVVAPVAAALAIEVLDRLGRNDRSSQKGLLSIYCIAVLASVLVHGMGPVWCGLLIVPFALGEWLFARTRVSGRAVAGVVLPILACALILSSARGLVREVVTIPVPDVIPSPGAFSGLYLPGMPFSLGTDTTNPITWVFTPSFIILNPLFIMRYPLAIAGLLLTFALPGYLRSSVAARFLFWTTSLTLLLLFTPIAMAVTGWFLTPRLGFRLAWVLPWGLTGAFFLGKLKPRPVAGLLVMVAITLALARGNPRNYVASFQRMQGRNRPSPDAVAAFGFLASLPSPQGVILASEATGRMIPAFLPDAYPVNFREYGPVDQDTVKRLVERRLIDRAFVKTLEAHRVRYILIENGEPLAATLRGDERDFMLRYENASYSIWEQRGEPADANPDLESE